MDIEREKIMKMKYTGMNEDFAEIMRNRIKDDINFIGAEYLNLDNILSYYSPKYRIFWILGSRGRGKTYLAKRVMINRYLKWRKNKKRKFQTVWVRRTDSALDELKADGGKGFLEGSLTEQKGVISKISGGKIYFKMDHEDDDEWVNVGTLFALQSNERMKGNHFEAYNLIIMDELVKGASEKRMFDNTRAFANTLETIGRERQDVMVMIFANTIGEVEEFQGPLKYMPEPDNYGVYKLPHKRSILYYAKDSKEWQKRKAKGLAAPFTFGQEEFGNVANKSVVTRDGWMVGKDVDRHKKRRLKSFITSRNHIFHVFGYEGNYVVTKKYFHVKNEAIYAITRNLLKSGSRFNPNQTLWIKEMLDVGKLRFVDVMEMNEFLNDITIAGIIK